MRKLTGLTLAIAMGALKMLVEGAAATARAGLGVGEEDLRLVRGNAPWAGQERARVTRTIETLVFGAIDSIGIARFPVSAEYMGAAIFVFVAPANAMVASRWMSESRSAEDLMGDAGLEKELVTPEKLFALVAALHSDDGAALIRDTFEKKANGAIDKATVTKDKGMK